MKKIGIIGFGWLGSRVADHLDGKFDIYATTTSYDKLHGIQSQGFHAEIAVFSNSTDNGYPESWGIIHQLDAVIITIPLSERRSSQESLQTILSKLFSFIGKYEKQMFFTSTTGAYPNQPGIYTEEMMPVENVFIENEISKKFPHINILRLGGLMGDRRLLKNFTVSDLGGIVNHIHYNDVAEVIRIMMEKNVESKVYNVVAPLHPTKQEVISAQNNIPLNDRLYNDEQRMISSEKLVSELGFIFKYPDPRRFHLE
ncbi:hypothetical protein [Chryseobacterium sp. POE27]|uniref:hypothetical protein n=1 Tax=Chryseobacterium sp. POE27 TaxID=3138177 RepID=UPI00321B0AAE